MDLNFFALLALTAGIVALIFGGLVILKDSRKLGNRLFFLMCLSVGMWGVAYWFWLTKTSSASQALLHAYSLLRLIVLSQYIQNFIESQFIMIANG